MKKSHSIYTFYTLHNYIKFFNGNGMFSFINLPDLQSAGVK